jgi:hypothetical protein
MRVIKVTHSGQMIVAIMVTARKIGHRTEAGVCVVADLTLDDARTSYNLQKQPCATFKLAKRFADTVFHQLVCESSPLFMRGVSILMSDE